MSSMRLLAGSAAGPSRLLAHIIGFAGANLVVGPLTLWAAWTDGWQHVPASLGAALIGLGIGMLAVGARLITHGEAAEGGY